MRTWWIRKVAGFLVVAAVIMLALGGLVMALWNAILPDVLHTPEITYWQAVGLLLLTHILFRGVGHFGYRNARSRRHWKDAFERKLASMSPDEKAKFRAEWRRRCGWQPEENAETSTEENGVRRPET